MSIAQLLKDIRRERKLSQDDMSEILGISRPTLSKVETGAVDPSYKMLTALIEKFNVTPDILFTSNSTISDIVQEPTAIYGKKAKNCDEKDELIAALKEIIRVQTQLINELNKKLD